MNNLSAWQILEKVSVDFRKGADISMDVAHRPQSNYKIIASLEEGNFPYLKHIATYWLWCLQQQKAKENKESNGFLPPSGFYRTEDYDDDTQIPEPYKMVHDILGDLLFVGIYEDITPFPRAAAEMVIFSRLQVGLRINSILDFGGPIFDQSHIGSHFTDYFARIMEGERIYPENLNYEIDAPIEGVIGQVTKSSLKQIYNLSRQIAYSLSMLDPWSSLHLEMVHFSQRPQIEYLRFLEVRRRLNLMLNITSHTIFAGVIDDLGDDELHDAIEICKHHKKQMRFLIAPDWRILLIPT